MDSLFDKETVGFGMKIAATLFTGFYAGGGLSICNAQYKAWKDLPAEDAIKYWHPSFKRNQQYQRRLALGSLVSSTGAFLCTYGTPKQDFSWLAAAGIVALLGPYTKICILPLNNQLLDTDKAIEKGDKWIRASIDDWYMRHSLRPGVTSLLFGFMLYKLAGGL